MNDELRRIEGLLRAVGRRNRGLGQGAMTLDPTFYKLVCAYFATLFPDLPGDAFMDLVQMTISYQRDPESYA